MTLRIADTATTAPATEPVTMSECRLDSRIDDSRFDTLLEPLIVAARQMCEQECGRKLVTQTWRATSPDWPTADDRVALTPMQSITATYWTGSTWATLAADQYSAESGPGGIVVLPAYGVTWPTLGNLTGPRVRIDVVCGYGEAAAVPESLKMWIRQHVAAMLRAPDGLGDDRKMVKLHYLDSLIWPHKAMGF